MISSKIIRFGYLILIPILLITSLISYLFMESDLTITFMILIGYVTSSFVFIKTEVLLRTAKSYQLRNRMVTNNLISIIIYGIVMFYMSMIFGVMFIFMIIGIWIFKLAMFIVVVRGGANFE